MTECKQNSCIMNKLSYLRHLYFVPLHFKLVHVLLGYSLPIATRIIHTQPKNGSGGRENNLLQTLPRSVLCDSSRTPSVTAFAIVDRRNSEGGSLAQAFEVILKDLDTYPKEKY